MRSVRTAAVSSYRARFDTTPATGSAASSSSMDTASLTTAERNGLKTGMSQNGARTKAGSLTISRAKLDTIPSASPCSWQARPRPR